VKRAEGVDQYDDRKPWNPHTGAPATFGSVRVGDELA
jgi:hypothetical protein